MLSTHSQQRRPGGPSSTGGSSDPLGLQAATTRQHLVEEEAYITHVELKCEGGTCRCPPLETCVLSGFKLCWECPDCNVPLPNCITAQANLAGAESGGLGKKDGRALYHGLAIL